MPRSALSLTKETLVELTSDEMATVVGGGDTDSCSCSILVVCINLPQATAAFIKCG